MTCPGLKLLLLPIQARYIYGADLVYCSVLYNMKNTGAAGLHDELDTKTDLGQ